MILRALAALLLAVPALVLAPVASAQSLPSPLEPGPANSAAAAEPPVFELSPQLPPSALTEHEASLAIARHLDAQTRYEAAADAYEQYARACLDAPDSVCASTHLALERAFALRRVLGQFDRADHVADLVVAHLLYARPRLATRIGFDRVRMHLERGDSAGAEAALDALDEHLPSPPPAQLLVSDALRAQAARSSNRPRRAALYWRRVERRFSELRAEMAPDGPVSLASVQEAVAEGRLARAESAVTRFLAVRTPRERRVRDARRWWSRTMSPWLVRSRRRLLLARMELERVYELGSPRHSVIAAARIGQLYGHQAALHDGLALPDDERVRALVHQGQDRLGYDQARSHFQTCIRWATHHGVAEDWSARCTEALHGLEPSMATNTMELHGAAAYRPTSLEPAQLPR